MTATASSPDDERGGTPSIRVLHADHSRARGGAEFALLRMLNIRHDWMGVVAVPGSDANLGVWSQLTDRFGAKTVSLGTAHSAGASSTSGVRGILRFARQVLAQSRAMRRHPEFRGADVVHANTSRAGLYCSLAAIGTKKPVVIHLRDIVDKDNLGGFGFAITTRFVLPRARGVIANSEATLAAAKPYIPASARIAVIPSAIGVERSPRTLPVPRDVRTIGMVARIDTWKGQDLLLRAFARAHGESKTRLAFAGSADFDRTPHLQHLQDLARELGIAERVDFLGHVEDVPGLLTTWDVCVQASTRPEPLGQNVLQYLALGCPSVVTDEGGPAEWVIHEWNGLTFRMGDESSLADALTALNDPELRQRLADNAPTTPRLMSDSEVTGAHASFFREVSVATTRKTQR